LQGVGLVYRLALGINIGISYWWEIKVIFIKNNILRHNEFVFFRKETTIYLGCGIVTNEHKM
jgi:hypothetical protein